LNRYEPDEIDLWVTGYYAGAYIAAKAGVTGVVPVRVFHTSQNYLACHPSVPEVELGKMQAALDAMKRDGTRSRKKAGADSARTGAGRRRVGGVLAP
jgi:hypothetical protein